MKTDPPLPPADQVQKGQPANVGTDDQRSHRRLGQRLIIIVVQIIVGVAITEIVVRVAGIEPHKMLTKRRLIDLKSDPPVYYHCYPDNPHGEFIPTPDVAHGDWRLQDHTFEHNQLPLAEIDKTPWCVEYRHSSKGIRDREFAPETPSGITRIAVIGDSFVFGEGVAEKDTLPRQIGHILGGTVECINGGQVGANTEQEVVILDNIVRETDSSRALLVFIANDITMTQKLARQQHYINDLILIRDQYLKRNQAWYSGRLRLLDFASSISDIRKIKRDTIQWYRDCYDRRLNGVNLDRMRSRFSELAQRSDCRTVIVLYPLLEGFESGYPLQEIHDTVARMAQDVGLSVIDLAPAFAGRNTRSLWVHESDHHPNRIAQQIAAEAIVSMLRERVPGFLPPSAEVPEKGRRNPSD